MFHIVHIVINKVVTPCTVTPIVFTKLFDLKAYESTKDLTNCRSTSLGGDCSTRISFSLIIFCYAVSLMSPPSSLISLPFSSRTRGPTPCFQMIMIMDNGKTGRLECGVVTRHCNPLLYTMA